MAAGIHPPFEAFYILAMQWHTESAARSIELLQRWLELVDADDERALALPKEALFQELQNILHQFGCISRYFFPARNASIHADRAMQLRQAFAVPADSPLADRELRNAIEHFDERLDKYLAGHLVGQIIPDHVGYSVPESEVPLHVFKGFYVENLTFVLLGQPHEMRPIIAELVRLHNLLIDCDNAGLRLPR
ncbi:hypothetical protein [Novosphingobium sp. FKTRR1]|uniref:hypothetical protein n=1 Tax=Novosphingobium sp. FKTRR1 TaxID=2879118 RepID=UPI001CF051E1|nr:hypothetical protein [Novosphingobium sp. FKTRR1]